MTHYQIIVIHPKNTKLEDVMYPYQEIDKDTNGKIKDERCNFYLTVPEKEIPDLLNKIKQYFEKRKQIHLERLQYRAEHTVEEFKEKYNRVYDFYHEYIWYYKRLTEYEKVKDLPYDNPEQIQFIIEYGSFATDKWIELYVPDMGYGVFENPYELFDYYRVIETSEELKYCGEYFVVFCESDDAYNSMLYTFDDIRFNKKCNMHCRVEDMGEKILEIQDKIRGKDFLVEILDIHN